MLGDSSLGGGGGGGGGGSSSDAVAARPTVAVDGGDATAAGSNSGEDERGRGEEGDRSFGGNRWPRQETLALLKIRSDMDVAFRDASVKGPLWEDVSRKLAEMGYHRSAKKCKEKFENVYKYHKRTKEGRTGKSEGKTYRFFDQLEALDHQNHPPPPPPPPPPPQPQQSKPPQLLAIPAAPVSVVATTTSTTPLSSSTSIPPQPHVSTVPSTITLPQANVPFRFPPPPSSTANPTSSSFPSIPTDLLSNSASSSTSSDESIERRHRRKRKWKDFFGRLTKEVIEKQEEMQKRFLEAIEKREHERMVREEAWRMQEMARINREREILAQERSIAAAKDAAVMAFLQKIAEQQNLGLPLNNINVNPPPQPPHPHPIPAPAMPVPMPAPTVQLASQSAAFPAPAPQPAPPQQLTNMEIVVTDNNNNNNGENLNLMARSSSRWPKVEVQALIKLRTSMDEKYQDNGPKGPLWEEISAAMRRLGYNRNAKRCKEKWENINKYFKKVKESNKKRPEDAKTCPYFHLLDALYREKNKLEMANPSSSANHNLKEDTAAPLMVRPEQQWPPQLEVGEHTKGNKENINNNNNNEEDEEEDVEEEKDIGEEDEEDEEEEGGGNYEIVASKPASVSAAE